MTSSATPSQRLSRTLFGQAHRLDILMLASASNGLFTLSDLAATLGVAQSALQAPLRDLQATGIIRPATLREVVTAGLDLEDVRRRKYYTRNDASKIWPWVEQLREEVGQGEGRPSHSA